MPPLISTLTEEARIVTRSLFEFGAGLFNPTIRLGVTGLSRAGKTVFITALVHGLIRGGRFPIFEAMASGRIARAYLAPQPDDAIPRFDYETHVRALVTERRWPESTRQISELRIVIEYQSASGAERTLTVDIVDYPGEWLLDLPLLNKTYAQWSAETIALSRQAVRRKLAAPWHLHLAKLDPKAPEDEQAALKASSLFTQYLKACRDERYAMSLLPPGRFLLPGDLAGSPALTFAPLSFGPDETAPRGSLWAMMERRFESYKDVLVRPFFREHFVRLDRQIVLVDALSALNAGPGAIRDLQATLTAILGCFRTGRWNLASALFRPRIDRILFAATKADHLHHSSHDRLENILSRMTEEAIERSKFAGARIDMVAIAAVRATREAIVTRGRDKLPSILGTPIAGEIAGADLFDGQTETAIFPGDLPDDPTSLFDFDLSSFTGLSAADAQETDYRFLRFRPPLLELTDTGIPALPHIRFDRAVQFLLGDRLT